MRLYNALTKAKEIFIPLNKNIVKMYVCGITPYDTTHLGHAFTYVFFDVLFRYLTFKGYKVVYLQNITDIDDGILKRAKELKKNWQTLGEYWTKRYVEDMKSLKILPPTIFKKATSAIDKIIEIVKFLIDKKMAYIKNNNVYFEINKFKKFGKLSHYSYKQMLYLAKDRGENVTDPYRKNPLDILLWQKSKDDEPRWSSPWAPPGARGKVGGMPGWHIECPALINKHLASQIDIHGGGRDLNFPHHDNEIAISESFTGKSPFVKYWMHTSMVMYEGEKMSKSLGNLIMVSDLLKKYSRQAVRFVLLSHFYRTPWEFNEDEFKKADKFFKENKNLINKVKATSSGKIKLTADFNKFVAFLNDDLNLPEALKEFKQLVRTVAKEKNYQTLQTLKTELNILGLE